jgi:HPt (histidine-containing phosphotransfer) domain-containing protein
MDLHQLHTKLSLNYFIEFGDSDPDFLREMIEIFLVDAPAMLAQMRLYANESKLDELKKIAHKFKSVVAVFELNEAYEFVAAVEKGSLQPNSTEFQSALNTFIANIQMAEQECQNILNQL